MLISFMDALAFRRGNYLGLMTKTHKMQLLPRSLYSLRYTAVLTHVSTARLYATHNRLGPSSLPTKREAVTVLNDNGHIPWNDLSRKEKFMRGTRQTFNFSLIACGATLSGGVAYIIYTQVLSPDSQTSHLNMAFDRIKKDSRCIALLGDGNEITAYGESTTSKWRKSRPLVSKTVTDENGTKHLFMQFSVNGIKNSGTVYLQLVKRPFDSKFWYRYLVLQVEGKPKVYLEDARVPAAGPSKKLRLFGVTWS